MRHSLKIVFLFLLVVLSSCLNNSEEFIADNDSGDVGVLLEKVDIFNNVITINPSVDNTILTPSNEVIVIPANTVVNENNSQVNGNVTVKYGIQKNRVADVVKNRDTKVNGQSHMALYNVVLQLVQGSKTLKIADNSNGVTFKVPYNSSENQTLPNIYQWSEDEWSLSGNSEVVSGFWKIETNNGTIFGIGYETNIKESGEFMVSIPSQITTGHNLCLILPENFTSKNTVTYAVFSDDKVVYKMKFENGQFCAPNLPIDKVVKMVSLSEQNGKYYITENSHRLTKSFNIRAVPKNKSLDEIKDWLRAM